MNQSVISVPKLKFSEPRHNLPGRKGVATAEDRFTIAFARAYLKQADSLHSGSPKTERFLVREVSVNGYGITDLLAIAWHPMPHEMFENTEAFVKVVKPTCRAFEMKLSNWRKAMQQASRYRNFAHQPIVVLPISEFDKAIHYIKTFKCIKVGLWGFDKITMRIIPYYTPRPRHPKSCRYYIESVKKASQSPKSTLPIL